MSSNATGSDEILVSTNTTELQRDASLSALPNGGWLVTWHSYGPDGDSIYMTHYDADGLAYNQTQLFYSNVLPISVGYQYYASAATLADGSWVLTVTPHGLDGSGSSVFQERFFADGTVSAFSLVNTYTFSDQTDPSVAALADGGWVVTWQSYGEASSEYNAIYQQRYDAEGIKVGGEILVGSDAFADLYHPSVISLVDGGWLVTWDVFGEGVYQQRYAANGNEVGAEILVNNSSGSYYFSSSVAGLSDGGWIVTWETAIPDVDSQGIYQQRYAANGDEVGGEALVNDDTDRSSNDPTPTGLADGGWVVTWETYDQDGDGYGIYQQRYDADGNKAGSETQVNISTANDQKVSSVVALADGGWVVTWESGIAGENSTIYQRHFATDIVGTDNIDVLLGTNWDEYLVGKGGDDILDGKGGDDIMAGGTGDDTYFVNSAEDTIDETGGSGTDLIKSSVSWTLGADVENLTLTGIDDIGGRGNGSDNILTGNSGANILEGGDGDDTLDGDSGDDALVGGAGSDTYIVNSNGDTVDETGSSGNDRVKSSVNWTLGAGFESLIMTGSSAINGNGNDLGNTIEGNFGNNVLHGYGDNDTLYGGAGTDTLYGDIGNDTLNGEAGADKMYGGAGNDAYYIDNPGDMVLEVGGGGTDTVYSNFSVSLQQDDGLAFTLLKTSGSIDRLTLTGSGNLNGYGNALNNVITGNSGNNGLRGFVGDDTLYGGEGTDTLRGGSGKDKLDGGSGTDTADYRDAKSGVTVNMADTSKNTGYAQGDTFVSIENLTGSNLYSDLLTGNSSANTISGMGGKDVIEGGGGADKLYGGANSDRFVFGSLSASSRSNADTIYDFTSGDFIDLRPIDANTKSGGNQTFKFIDTHAFTGHAGELRYVKQSSDTYIYADVNGDKKADLTIHLDDAATLKSAFFIL